MRALPALLLLAFLPAACARGAAPSPVAAMRAGQWPAAQAEAAAGADPVAARLVEYDRMLTPGAARADEVARFLDENPAWPNRALMARRLAEALPALGEDAAALRLCATRVIGTVAGQLRCAAAARAPGADPAAVAAATDDARRAWTDGLDDPAAAPPFLAAWGAALTPADEWTRFDRLDWSGSPLAVRQAERVAPAVRPLALARLAFRGPDPATAAALGATLAAALPPEQRTDPALVLEQARALRRAGQDAAAVALWQGPGPVAEAAAPAPRRPAFWSERELLARHLLHAGQDADAFALADDTLQDAPAPRAEAAFLAGWIALRRLHDPHGAASRFRLVAAQSSVLTRSRGLYWLGRADTATGDADAAHRDYAAAAALPTTFYGQLAALAGGETGHALLLRLGAARDPDGSGAEALDLAGAELARAAELLVAWGEPRRATPFLLALDAQPEDASPARQALLARMALGFGLPQDAVAVARRAGREGTALPVSGWPLAVTPPAPDPDAEAPAAAVPPALLLGLVRQESGFDPEALSPSGARGLAQLMPATAREEARRLNEPASLTALTADPAYNLRLGAGYLGVLLARFAGTLPLAVAAYNAGPGRVGEWLAQNGDPRARGADDMLDWIELIPASETRNYVQRVLENAVVYQARLGGAAPRPLPGWLG